MQSRPQRLHSFWSAPDLKIPRALGTRLLAYVRHTKWSLTQFTQAGRAHASSAEELVTLSLMFDILNSLNSPCAGQYIMMMSDCENSSGRVVPHTLTNDYKMKHLQTIAPCKIDHFSGVGSVWLFRGFSAIL